MYAIPQLKRRPSCTVPPIDGMGKFAVCIDGKEKDYEVLQSILHPLLDELRCYDKATRRGSNTSIHNRRRSLEWALEEPENTIDKSQLNAPMPRRKMSATDEDNQMHCSLILEPTTASPVLMPSPRSRVLHRNHFLRSEMLCSALEDMGLFDEEEPWQCRARSTVVEKHTRSQPHSHFPPSA